MTSEERASRGGLDVRGVAVRFGATTAVDDVSFHLPAGEVLALLGPSGCGKSTLLRAIAGLIEPAGRAIAVRGEVAWDGKDLTHVPVHKRGFGLMFQTGELFGHLSVAANVAYGLAIARTPRAERAARVAELLDLVGLAGFGEREVAELSGGEAQRVALARALAPRPRLLLLDEPLSALDRSLRERLAAHMRQVLTATGTTAIFVTHDPDEAMTLADRLALMDAGRIRQIGPAEDVWKKPADEASARLVGFRTFLAGQASGGEVQGEWGRLALPVSADGVVEGEGGRVALPVSADGVVEGEGGRFALPVSADGVVEGEGGRFALPVSASGAVLVAARPGAFEEQADGHILAQVIGEARYGRDGCLQPCALRDGTEVEAVVVAPHAIGDQLRLGAQLARITALPAT